MHVVRRSREKLANPTFDSLFVILAAGVLLDFGTTAIIFFSPAYGEANEFLTALAAVHVSLALAYNLGYGMALVAAYSFVGGWLGRVGATFALTSAFLGVNNLLYFASGDPSPIYVLFDDAVPLVLAYGIPALGLVGGTIWHAAREESLPLRLIGATVVVGVGMELVNAVVA